MASSPFHRITQAGVASALCYAGLLIPSGLLAARVVQTGADPSRLIELAWRPWTLWGQSGGLSQTLVMDGALFAIIAVVFGVYWRLMRDLTGDDNLRAPNRPEQAARLERRVFWWSVALGAILLAVVPFDSRDLYGYLNRGAQQAFYALNPYVASVGQTPGWRENPMFHAHWLDNPAPYGPLFLRAVQGVCLLAGERFWLAFLLMKSLSLALHALNCALILRLARAWGAARPWQAALCYGWHPLMLLQMIANGHNDLWVSSSLLAGLWLLTPPQKAFSARAAWLAWPVIAACALTKFASALALPMIALVEMRQKRWRALAGGALAAIALTLVLAGPYLLEIHHFGWRRMASNAVMAQHSLHAAVGRAVFYAAQWGPGLAFLRDWVEPARVAVKWVTLGGFLALYGWALRRLWQELGQARTQAAPRLAYWLTLTLTALLTLASAKFHPWYLGMVFPLAVVTPPQSGLWDWPRRFALALASVQMLAFTPLNNLHVVNFALLIATPMALSFLAARRAQTRAPENGAGALQ